MDILFVAPELAPIVKVGGLADVVFALSKTLRTLGHKVTIAMPRYAAFDRAGILVARRLTPMVVPPLDPASHAPSFEVTLYDGRLATGVEVVLFDIAGPDGKSLYEGVTSAEGDGVYEGPPEAVAMRFAYFCRAVVEFMRQRTAVEQGFEIVHAHDWPAAMVAYLTRLVPDLAATRSVLTIHNLAHQGNFGREALKLLGLGEDHFTPARLEFYGGVSFMKAGLVAADTVTTVSNTYARDILTPELGERLDGVLRARKDAAIHVPPVGGAPAPVAPPLVGILNGVDYAVWNPATDPALVARYDAYDPSNKRRSTSALLNELGLEMAPQRPVFLSLGRIVHQKGADILAEALPKILKQDLSFVIAGAGDRALEEALAAGAARAPDRCKVLGRVSEAMAHRLLAAADFVVLPSRYEPCGLVQVHAQRYGTLPIASRTGGFIDTIVDADANLEGGTGFLFDGPTPATLAGAIGRALAAFTHPRFPALMRRAMRLDVGWERPARRYVQLYRALLVGVGTALVGASGSSAAPRAPLA